MSKQTNLSTISITETIEELEQIKSKPFSFMIRDMEKLQKRLDFTKTAKQDTWDLKSIIIGMGFGIATTLLFTIAFPVHADSLDLNLTSWHADKSYSYNTKNFGIGYTKDLNHHWQAQVGQFKNSYDKDSVYAGFNLKHDMKNWRWGISFGFITGYDNIETNINQSHNQNTTTIITSQKDKFHPRYNKSHDRHEYKNKSSSSSTIIHTTVIKKHHHPKNLNQFQFTIAPNITWKITKSHALQLTYIPETSKEILAFAGLRYQYTFGE